MARMLGLFFGTATRNDPIKLEDPHPINKYADPQHSGNAGLDGFTVLARARPGKPSPPTGGQEGLAYFGQDEAWEQ